jgi:hypothetical protein
MKKKQWRKIRDKEVKDNIDRKEETVNKEVNNVIYCLN